MAQVGKAELGFTIAAFAKSIKGEAAVTVKNDRWLRACAIVKRRARDGRELEYGLQAGLLLQLSFVVTKDQSSYAGPMSESAPRTHHLTSFVGEPARLSFVFAIAAFAKSIKSEAPVTGESMCNRQARGEAPVTVETRAQ